MRPRGCPPAVQIKPEVWRLVPPIGVAGVVGHRGHVCPVGKPNRRAMHVRGRPGCPVGRSGPDSGHHRVPIGARPGFSAHGVAFDSEGKLQVDRDRSPNGNGPLKKVTVDSSVGNPNGAHPKAGHISTQRCAVDQQLHQDLFVTRLDGQPPDSRSRLDRHGLRITRPPRGTCHEVRLRNSTAVKADGPLGGLAAGHRGGSSSFRNGSPLMADGSTPLSAVSLPAAGGTVTSVCSDTMVAGCEKGQQWVLSSNAY